jgi:uncharacterized protein
MSNYKVIDVLVWLFMEDMKPVYERAAPLLKVSLERAGTWERTFTDPSEYVEAMDAAGVEKAIIAAQSAGVWEVPYERVFEATQQFPGRLYGMAGIDPRDIKEGVSRLELAVRDYGFVGAHSYPHWFQLPPDDRKYYPFYEKCVELDVPIQIQVGRASQRSLVSVARPETIDRLAVDFPDLKVIGIHTGAPWEREFIHVSWKHPNVYVGCDGRHPRTWARDLVDYIRGEGTYNGGPGKCIFGTNFPLFDFDEMIDAVDALEFDADIRRSLLRDNALKVYRLD